MKQPKTQPAFVPTEVFAQKLAQELSDRFTSAYLQDQDLRVVASGIVRDVRSDAFLMNRLGTVDPRSLEAVIRGFLTGVDDDDKLYNTLGEATAIKGAEFVVSHDPQY